MHAHNQLTLNVLWMFFCCRGQRSSSHRRTLILPGLASTGKDHGTLIILVHCVGLSTWWLRLRLRLRLQYTSDKGPLFNAWNYFVSSLEGLLVDSLLLMGHWLLSAAQHHSHGQCSNYVSYKMEGLEEGGSTRFSRWPPPPDGLWTSVSCSSLQLWPMFSLC